MNFSDAEEEKLINLVVENPAIFNVAHRLYQNVLVKEDIWRSIGTKMNKSIDDCKKKWKFMRDGYTRFRRKSNFRPGSAVAKQIKFKRYQQLGFLDNCPQRPCNRATEASNVPDDNVEDDNDDIGDDNLLSEEDQDAVLSSFKQEQMGADEAVEVEVAVEDKVEDSLLQMWKQTEENRKQLYKPMVEKVDDDIDLFCKHISLVLRKLPPYLRAKAKKQLGEILSDYEIMAARHSFNDRSSVYYKPSPSHTHESSSLDSDPLQPGTSSAPDFTGWKIKEEN